MISYKLDYTIDTILRSPDFNARKALKSLTGKSLNRKEAATVWLEVQDHKWLVSRRLGRDIGLRVAAVDYLENFHRPDTLYKNFIRRFKQPLSSLV